MLRGGKAVKIETHSLSGDRNFAWVENFNFHPLSKDQRTFDDRDNAEFLKEEGQLQYDLACQLDDFTEFGVNQQDIVSLWLYNSVEVVRFSISWKRVLCITLNCSKLFARDIT